MPTVLITGANRGIGLEFARQYSSDGWDVIAIARHSSPELDALGAQVASIDLSDAEAVAAFGVETQLNLFIANAGTSEPKNPNSADDLRAWQQMMMVNAIAPYQLGKGLLPRMADGGKMIAISSGMGSIGDNGGGWGPYPPPKAGPKKGRASPAPQGPARGGAAFPLNPRRGKN